MESKSYKQHAHDQIAVYRAMLDFLPTIKEVAKKFDGKVLNARFTTALEEASPKVHIGAPEFVDRIVPMFFCKFDQRWAGADRDLKIELYYIKIGNKVVRHLNEFNTRIWGLEDYKKPLYNGPMDYEDFAANCDKCAEVIRGNIAKLEDEIANLGKAIKKYMAIYEELKKLEPYRHAVLNTKEWELRNARAVAEVLPV